MMRRLGFVTVVAMLGVLTLASPASALHSTTSPRTYWDANDDWVADDAIVLLDAQGSSWTQTKLDRLNAAVDEWSSFTDFDPGRTVTGNYDVYVDGTVAPCGSFASGVLGITCQTVQDRYNPGTSTIHHWRIVNKDTYTNIYNYTWWYGSTHTGAENVADFEGMLVHEVGHWARLIHVPGDDCSAGTAIETMCQFVFDVDDDTWRMRSLTSDDIASANAYYP